MIDIGNNLGKRQKCKYREKEKIEHILECGKENEKRGEVQKKWLQEIEDRERMRDVNDWVQRYIDRRSTEEEE